MLGKVLEPLLFKVFVASARAGARTLTRPLRTAARAWVQGAPFTFDATNPAAVDWIKEHAAESIRGISDTTRDSIKELVEDAFVEQFDVDALAEGIEEILGDGDSARAETIARTETIRASNEGQQALWEQATEAGLLTGREQQEWIVTPDDRLCEICAPLEGQTVGLGEMFDVDGEDVDGPPAHPNCRCTIGLAE